MTDIINEAYDKAMTGIKTKILQNSNKRKKKKKSKKKRAFNWNAIQGIIDSEKTDPKVKAVWKKAMKLHKDGLSDKQVRAKMGWTDKT